MDKYCNEAHPPNAPIPMLVTLSGMTISDRELQPRKTLLPMLVTLSGMTMLEREPQVKNAAPPMLVTLSGMTMLDRELQLKKSTKTNASNTIRDDNIRQRTTPSKCIIAYYSSPLFDRISST